MEIYSAKTKMVEKLVEVNLGHETEAFTVSVRTKDGKVVGDFKNGLTTSRLSYFHDTPEEERKKHFEQIKKYVERRIK